MNTEVATITNQSPNPFTKSPQGIGGNVGAIAIESARAVAEAEGQLVLAKKFPRSNAASIAEFVESCHSADFAAVAFYAVPNRGSGPSIRFAEEAARCYGNFEYGHRELSRNDKKSEVEVYAWDKQNNNRSIRQITVNHVLDTKNGPRTLTDQTDIDNKIANVASKQMRGRILALLPKHLVAIGIAEVKRTLAGGAEKPIAERLGLMSSAFSRFGVTGAMLEKHLGHSVDNTTIDELADLTGIFNAIKDGAKASEYFKADEIETVSGPKAAIAAAIAKNAAATPAATAAAAETPAASATAAAAPKKAAVVKKTAPAPTPEPEPEPDQQPEPPPVDGDSEEVF
jgi:hypothetical protein